MAKEKKETEQKKKPEGFIEPLEVKASHSDEMTLICEKMNQLVAAHNERLEKAE